MSGKVARSPVVFRLWRSVRRHPLPALAVLALVSFSWLIGWPFKCNGRVPVFFPQPASFHVSVTPDWFEVTPESAPAEVQALRQEWLLRPEPGTVSGPCRLVFAFDSMVLRDTGRPAAKFNSDTINTNFHDFYGINLYPVSDTEHLTGVALVTFSAVATRQQYFSWRSGKLVRPSVYKDLGDGRIELSPREITFAPLGEDTTVVVLVRDTLTDSSAILVPASFGVPPSSMGAVFRPLQARTRGPAWRSLALYTRASGPNGTQGFTLDLPDDRLGLSVRESRIRFLSEGIPLAGTFRLALTGSGAPFVCYTTQRRPHGGQFYPPGVSVTLDSARNARGAVYMSGGSAYCRLADEAQEATVAGRPVAFTPNDLIEVHGVVQYAFHFEAYSPPTLALIGTATSFKRNGKQILMSRWDEVDSGIKGGLVGFAATLLTLLVGATYRGRRKP